MTDIKTQECVKFKTPEDVDGKSMLQENEVPQSQEMIPLTECLDDEGVALPSTLSAQVSKGLVIPYLRFPCGVQEFVPTQTRSGNVIQLPRGTTFLRGREGTQSLGGLPQISGGSI